MLSTTSINCCLFLSFSLLFGIQWTENGYTFCWCGNHPKICNIFFGLRVCSLIGVHERSWALQSAPGYGNGGDIFVRIRRSTCLFWKSTTLASWVHFLLAVIRWWSRDEAISQPNDPPVSVGRTVLRSCEKSTSAFVGIHRQCAWAWVYFEGAGFETNSSSRDVPVRRATILARGWLVPGGLRLMLRLQPWLGAGQSFTERWRQTPLHDESHCPW